MASFKYIVSALAIAGGAAAASSCSAATTTIQNAGDASAIGASCTTFTGSIAIATGTTDTLNFGQLREIDGSLTADSVQNLAGLQGGALQSITGTFSLQNLTTLSNLNFPFLTSVKSIDWSGLKNLQSLSFSSNIQMASNLSIQDTQLTSLTGINLQTVDTVLLANNVYLGSVSMQLGNVTESLIVTDNGRNVSAEFPNLVWAHFMTVNNVSSFKVPSLQTINTSFALNSDYVTEISGPNLTSIGNDLSVINCPQLTNISFPQLKSIGGGLKIADNVALKQITGFPKLASIGGALDYHGNFTNATLPSISSIIGAFNMQSQSDISSTCNYFSQYSGNNNVIHGSYNCTGSVSTPTSGDAGSGTSSGSGSSTTTTKNAAVGSVQIGAASGFLAIVACIFGLL